MQESLVQIEQAIFTSARTEHAAGYQLVARSPGITPQQARELAVWGPSHDALDPQRDEQSSVNFHRLACGTFCISKTVASGQEYSSRGGARIYTQFLLVPPAVLARFANNPFAVLRAAWAKGVLVVHEHPPSVLEAFTLAGRSAAVDEGLLAQLADQWGPHGVARLLAVALLPGVKLLTTAAQHETLFGGLLQCFPVNCRTELTFTTGLRFSPRRPFQLAPLVGDAAEGRRAARHEGVTVIDLSSSNGTADSEPAGWPAYVAEIIRSDQLPRLVSDLQQARPDLQLKELNELGTQLLHELRREPAAVAAKAERQKSQSAAPSAPGSERLFRTDPPIRRNSSDTDSQSRQSSNGKVAASSTAVPQPPGVALAAGSGADVHTVADPATVELLEQLDDAVYEAVNGSPTAPESVAQLWTQLSKRLKPATLSAMREQYLRYALSLWDACLEEAVRQPQRAIGALDVLAVLFHPE
jgi:hypothetical protein